MKILNIAAGKQKPLDDIYIQKRLPIFIVNVDTSYFEFTYVNDVEKILTEEKLGLGETLELNCNYEIIEFMERTRIIFDHIVIYRYLEHVSFTQLNYFTYLVSTVIKKDGVVDVIVPNYNTLAKMILKEDPYTDKNFEASNILLTTELLNEPSCPHASIWTPKRAKYFWELEGRFEINQNEIYPKFSFDGRDNIYMRFFARRV